MSAQGPIGIIGGNGQLGGAIARGILMSGTVAPERLWISSRSGQAAGFDAWPGVRFTRDNGELSGACETVILSVPPANAKDIAITAPDRLVVSVMAGVTRADLARLTGAVRIVRAMSSPAAGEGLAYSPWVASEGVTEADRATVRAIFGACGVTDEIADEAHIDHFTAMTGPVPGFVALFADGMIRYAEGAGIAPDVAERAVRQLFLASGEVLGKGAETPAGQVRAMVDYAGTTAAGLVAMEKAGIARVIAEGLDAAVERARGISRE
ncbi:Pyrroline-5-carboxylate reductase [Defluviimonas aquaemixtae]|uniref:Pyrroline-5-carboxylate reductase n=1 Tax=Albidovulum aquaemixtae TaxID=1542388 RepID=A0A2R8B298_9RHOB|nr:pyrroline-5-carboxylate reductase dimerization domain-containing protein [Defluviimonas aquaemixtae]SPH16741.1 Pyrroline-5-carboxylate reductase [Defluviimonas aquaemixtae]